MSAAALRSVNERTARFQLKQTWWCRERGRQSRSQKMTVWFVNRQLGFVWRGWTKRAACPRGGRRQPDSLIWAAWDSGRRDLDWPKSTPQLRYSLSILCLPVSPPLLPRLYSDYGVHALFTAWVRERDNRTRQPRCISTFTPLFSAPPPPPSRSEISSTCPALWCWSSCRLSSSSLPCPTQTCYCLSR